MLTLPFTTAWRAHRRYVHGTDLYLRLVDALARIAPHGMVGGIRLNLRRVLQSQPDYVFADGGDAPPPNAAADFSADLDGTERRGWICASERPVEGCVDYDEEVIRARAAIEDKSIRLSTAPPCRPIEAVLSLAVALNNHLHPPEARRWMLARMVFARPLMDADLGGLNITRRQILGGQMARLDVVSGDTRLGELMFSLSDIPSPP